ncbi:hypothetical protein DEJ48_26585 [Streptomyces venezuelae]|uniref:Integral membrane protein n=1 Tax=Streptomyces venezuelae TaxID=54571 RepID=A0A5P2C2K9_STRVZ|nr:hypothetical protein [Streptomyces venezuelae]QES36490.1 hypothetical protein DEJ48_26585 [Streptomyces venezuelae]
MGRRDEPTGAAGCLIAAVAAAVGFTVWLRGAGPGLSGGFEGERDLSLLYVELPLLVFGLPATAVVAWALTNSSLRHRTGRPARTAAATAASAITVTALAWAGLIWLDNRVAPFMGS